MDSHDIESYFRQHRRTLGVLLLVVGMAAVSGVFMGMRQTEHHSANLPTARTMTSAEVTGEFKAAPRYADISESGWLANDKWWFTFENLPNEAVALEDQLPLSSGELAVALAARSERRAFDGAPPTVPHEIDQLSSVSCIVCHGTDAVIKIGDKRPAAISHPYYSNCTQCHVPADGLRRLTEKETARLLIASAFVGRERAGLGTRAYVDAPPTVPHPLWMRQNCLSCHGPAREHAIKTSHPSRQNCLQCHALDADFDNRERISNSPPLADP